MDQCFESFTNQLDIANRAIKQRQKSKTDDNSDSGNSLFIASTNEIEQLELEMHSNVARDIMINLDVETLFHHTMIGVP